MGDGELVKLVKEYAEKTINIFHHPPVSTTFLLDYTASADIGLLLYDNSSLNHKYCMPNKLFEYMMAGLPVLVSNLQEIKKIVELCLS